MKYIKIFVALLIFISFTPFTSSASASEIDSVQKLWDGINGQLIDAKTNSFNETIAVVKDIESRLLLVKYSESGKLLKKQVFSNNGDIKIFKDRAGKLFVPVFVKPNTLVVYNEDLTMRWSERPDVRPENEYIYSSFEFYQDGDKIFLNNLRQTHGTESSNDFFVYTSEGELINIYEDFEFDFYPLKTSRINDGFLAYDRTDRLYGKEPSTVETNFRLSDYGFDDVHWEESYLYVYDNFDIAILQSDNGELAVKFDKSGNVLRTQPISGSFLQATDDYAIIRGFFEPSYHMDLNTLKLTKYNISEESIPDYSQEANAISDGEKVHILDDTGYISHSIQATSDVYSISEKYIAVASKEKLSVFERQTGIKAGEVSGQFDRVFPGKNDNEFYATNDNNWAYFSIGKTNVGTTYEPTKQWSISFSTEIDASTVTPS
ncbi:hypothetical protein [Lysinibacillus endophyticus]|uniref:hypothetical protein n=1 Tax=Ureibacillus endophyticus TaxID=1978490 RepID=UPI00209E7D15|nr:hypothetical protein [Lysinibacillus endophyticus]MCP1143684.1 hypothetical protein [Lysinibacillus endophyticus]